MHIKLQDTRVPQCNAHGNLGAAYRQKKIKFIVENKEVNEEKQTGAPL